MSDNTVDPERIEELNQPSAELQSLFSDIDDISDKLKFCVRKYKDQKIQDRSVNDKAAMILAFRAIKFIDGTLLTARAGYMEPSATLVRSIYETYLWSRWVILGNGQKYLDTLLNQMKAVANKLNDVGGLWDNSPAHESLKDPIIYPPKWSKLAEETDMKIAHNSFYPHFSNLSHGNAAGSIDIERTRVTFQSDFSAIDFTVKAFEIWARNILVLFEEWWTNSKVAPAPK